MCFSFYLCFSATLWTFLFETVAKHAVRYVKQCRTESAQRYVFIWDQVEFSWFMADLYLLLHTFWPIYCFLFDCLVQFTCVVLIPVVTVPKQQWKPGIYSINMLKAILMPYSIPKLDDQLTFSENARSCRFALFNIKKIQTGLLQCSLGRSSRQFYQTFTINLNTQQD